MPSYRNVVIENLETQLKTQERLIREVEEKLEKLHREKENFLNDINQRIEQASQMLNVLQGEKQAIEEAINILMQQMPVIPNTPPEIPPEQEIQGV